MINPGSGAPPARTQRRNEGKPRTIEVEAVVFDSSRPRQLELRSLAVPAEARSDEVVLEVELAGICASDLHSFDGWYQTRGPVIPGHEVVGTVLSAGDEVQDARGKPLTPGARIVPESSIPCHRCPACRGQRARQSRLVDYGFCQDYTLLGSIPLSEERSLTGGYATVMRLPKEAILHRVDQALSLRTAVLLEPFAVAMRAAWKADIRSGDVVAVVGPGAIGLLSVVAAREQGASQIILFGTRAERLAVGERLGATATVDVGEEEALKALLQAAGGRKADRVLDATGTHAGFDLALSLVARGGVYIGLGGLRPDAEVRLRPDYLSRQKIDVLFSHLGANAYPACLQVMRSARYPLEEIVTHIFPLASAEEALLTCERRQNGAIKVLLQAKGAGRG